jgi:hypothetical protein
MDDATRALLKSVVDDLEVVRTTATRMGNKGLAEYIGQIRDRCRAAYIPHATLRTVESTNADHPDEP